MRVIGIGHRVQEKRNHVIIIVLGIILPKAPDPFHHTVLGFLEFGSPEFEGQQVEFDLQSPDFLSCFKVFGIGFLTAFDSPFTIFGEIKFLLKKTL